MSNLVTLLYDLRNKYIDLIKFEEHRLALMDSVTSDSLNFYLKEVKKWHEKIEYRIEVLNDLIEMFITNDNKKFMDSFINGLMEDKNECE